MKWNWQQKNWPEFNYTDDELVDLEAQFLHQSGVMIGAFKHIADEEKSLLTVEIITDEAVKTSAIEGEFLNRNSVQSSVLKNLGLDATKRNIKPEEQGIADMMVDVYKNYSAPLSNEMLFSWHVMLTKGRTDLEDTGRYRTHKEPMQVVSGEYHNPKVHFEAPPSENIKAEMDQFIKWFNAKRNIGLLTHAGIAHLYFVSIHPFEDGNGRIGRAIAEKSLAVGLGHPTLISTSYMIEKHRKDYYIHLERNNKDLEITNWLVYFAKTVIDAQQYTQILINFLIEKTKFYDRFKSEFNERQAKVVERMFREGVEGFKGGLSAENYISITGTSRATATRDLNDLVSKGAFTKTGQLKHTRYYLNIKYKNAASA